MSDIDPNLNSVVSQEYWEPMPPLYNFSRHNAIARLFEVTAGHNPGETLSMRMDDSVHEQVCTLLSQTALQLLHSESVEQISQNELVGSKDDDRYFLPGNVLLIDMEEIDISREGALEHSQQTITNDFELAMSALALFKRSAKLITPTDQEPKQIWTPYEGSVIQKIDGKVHTYSREIDLFAVCPAKNGKSTTIGLNMMTIMADENVTVDVPKGNFDSNVGGVRRSMWPAARVGQVINRSVNDRRISLFRLRSAALCLRGSLEYAPARKRAHSRVNSGLVPNFIRPN